MADDVTEPSETDKLLIVSRSKGRAASTASAHELLRPEASSGQRQHDAGRDIHLRSRRSERSCRIALCFLLLLVAGGAALLLRPELLTSFLSLRQPACMAPSATLYSRYQAVCEAAGSNVVMNRGDPHGVDREQLRDWSVSAVTFAPQTELPACSSSQQLLQAVANGQRYPLPGYDFAHVNVNLSAVNGSQAVQLGQTMPQQVEWSRSHFLSAGCSLRWLTGERLCEVLSSFSHLLFVGDSLLRHVTTAMFMLLTEDLQYGAIPRLSYKDGLFDRCRCDGQFSEHALCRDFNNKSMFSLRDPRVYGVCTASTHYRFQFVFQQTPPHSPVLDLQGYCSADRRPRVLVLEAAAHFSTDWKATNSSFAQLILQQIHTLQSNCSHALRWHVLWLAMPAQSRLLDARRPHQTREKALLFNAAMARVLAEQRLYQVSVLDHWNLTVNAATSDGLHYLSDVNLQRANHIANLLNLWSET